MDSQIGALVSTKWQSTAGGQAYNSSCSSSSNSCPPLQTSIFSTLSHKSKMTDHGTRGVTVIVIVCFTLDILMAVGQDQQLLHFLEHIQSISCFTLLFPVVIVVVGWDVCP